MNAIMVDGATENLLLQAMLKYHADAREVRLTVDRDYKAGQHPFFLPILRHID